MVIEFAMFPTKIIRLIELCLESDDTKVGEVKGTTFYFAKLDLSDGVFAIIEDNGFKLLSQSKLRLVPGNDSAVKAYLASRLSSMTNRANMLSRELEATQNSLAEEQAARCHISSELQQLRFVTIKYNCLSFRCIIYGLSYLNLQKIYLSKLNS